MQLQPAHLKLDAHAVKEIKRQLEKYGKQIAKLTKTNAQLQQELYKLDGDLTPTTCQLVCETINYNGKEALRILALKNRLQQVLKEGSKLGIPN